MAIEEEHLLILSLVTDSGSVCQSARQSTESAAAMFICVLGVFVQLMQCNAVRVGVGVVSCELMPFCLTNLVFDLQSSDKSAPSDGQLLWQLDHYARKSICCCQYTGSLTGDQGALTSAVKFINQLPSS